MYMIRLLFRVRGHKHEVKTENKKKKKEKNVRDRISTLNITPIPKNIKTT